MPDYVLDEYLNEVAVCLNCGAPIANPLDIAVVVAKPLDLIGQCVCCRCARNGAEAWLLAEAALPDRLEGEGSGASEASSQSASGKHELDDLIHACAGTPTSSSPKV
jgi:hypothetical protein